MIFLDWAYTLSASKRPFKAMGEGNQKIKRFRRALLNDLDAARRMITEDNIDINWRYNYPETHLQFAVSQRNPRAVRFLLKRWADPNRMGSNWLYHNLYMNPLLHAVRLFDETDESYEALKLLLEKGADCNEGIEGITPFLYALESRNLKTIRLFLDHGAGIADRRNEKPTLHYAVKNPQLEVIQYILDLGFDIETSASMATQLCTSQPITTSFKRVRFF